METVLHIKNMVCRRCIIAVEQILAHLQINKARVDLGHVYLPAPLTETQILSFKDALEAIGFELLDDKRMQLIEQIKTEIIGYLYQPEIQTMSMSLSEYLKAKILHDYSSLSKLFSELNGITIEKYFIQQRIERVKELIVYDELSFSEIADKLNYSSVAHLSAQFKNVTGITPTVFKSQKGKGRKSLDQV